jgi:hypothetical protein
MKFRRKEPAMRIPQVNGLWTYLNCTVYVESVSVKEKGVLFVNVLPAYPNPRKQGWFLSVDEFLSRARPLMEDGKQRIHNV